MTESCQQSKESNESKENDRYELRSRAAEYIQTPTKEIDFRLHGAVLRERLMLYMFKGGATVEYVKDAVRKCFIADKEDWDEDYLDELVLTWLEVNREDGGKSKKSVYAELLDYIESKECKAPIDNLFTINLQEIYRDLNYRNPNEKTACRMAIKKLVAQDRIEVIGGKTGTYKIVKHTKLEPMRFITTEIPDFPVILPLDLNDMIKLHKQNIIVIAGSKSAGKSCLAMTIAVANQHRIPVDYFNSEMGEEEYSDRMKNMGFTSPDQIKFNMFPLHSDYHNYINGDHKIYIIDFLEVHDKFYEIAKPIRKIHEKLKDGICIVLIQMKPGADFGVGGQYSAEKARLYLKLEYEPEYQDTKITIADAKSPKQDNIRGMFRRVKIIKGAKISPLDNWHHGVKASR